LRAAVQELRLMPDLLSALDLRTGLPISVRAEREILAVVPGAADDGDLYIAPGWIDLQVNGFAGVDYNDPRVPLDDVARSLEALVATGVTRCYPTIITASPDAMRDALATLARAKAALPLGEVIDGFHVEGPHISPDDGPRGAHPRQWVRPPDLEEFRRWQDAAGGGVRMITIAPEAPGAPAYIEAVAAQGVVVAIGHTNATSEQLADAISAGATMSTHLGNAAPAMLRRHPNHLWEQLADDRLTASFIADGLHLPASFLTVAIRAKGMARSVLVTDASAPAGAVPGRYRLGEQDLDLTPDGRVVLAGGERLAGSALSMDRAVANVVRLAGVPLADAAAMATSNAARAGGVPGRTAGLVPGQRADVVRFRVDPASGRLQIHETYVSGRRVFRRG
jgi:N-acetylglucosamine-6-phosphate deacetylase